MTPTTTVTLGDFTFSGPEIPERLPFGGQQAIAVHNLVGGRRVIDSMGADHAPIEWSGILVGSAALSRARYLDWLRMEGKPQVLAWSEWRYTVIIRSFLGSFDAVNRIPYRIACEVVSYDSQPVKSAASAGVDELIADDLAQAKTLSSLIGDGPLSDAVGALDSAISAVSSFANATQSAIGAVLGPIRDIQGRAQTLIAAAGNAINSAATLGGIVPNSPIAQQAARLASQAAAVAQTPALLQINAVAGRMASVVGGGASAATTIATVGANLYRMAADAYGDASQWGAIAQANSLSDPMVSGVKQIKVPAAGMAAGGVFNA